MNTSQDLSERPDKWYENPCGWLTRPSYKRAAQKRGNEGRKSSWSDNLKTTFSASGTTYKRRWFVLDRANHTLKYYKDEISTEENGWIDLAQVREMRYSTVSDSPAFSLDLVSQDINYTVAASSKAELLRWAVALHPHIYAHPQKVASVDSFHARGSNKSSLSSNSRDLIIANNNSEVLLGGDMAHASPQYQQQYLQQQQYQQQNQQQQEDPESPQSDGSKEWLRYDYTLKRDGPLRINVMGTVDRDEDDNILSYWLIVSGFAVGPRGEQSEAKLSGQVRPKDYIVGVNGEDITGMEFAMAMNTLKSAPMPRTLHFLRDLREENPRVVYAASWAWVFYESLNKRRKRYVELNSYALSFRCVVCMFCVIWCCECVLL